MTVRVDVSDDVAEVVLDRPEVLNSLDAARSQEMHTALDARPTARGRCSSAARGAASPPAATCPAPSRSPRTPRRSSATCSTR